MPCSCNLNLYCYNKGMNFTINQLNSPFDDSAFFVRNIYRRNAFLFDCGRLGGLTHSDILSLGDIFVSHTHMDHFVGFDRILRGALKADTELRLFGPPGFINNVAGKFRGYTWNIIGDYTFAVSAMELCPEGDKCKIGYFAAKNSFAPLLSEISLTGKVNLGEGFTLSYDFFDHRTPSIGYRVDEPLQYNINKEKLIELGYNGGPWVSEFKRALAAGERDREITADNGGRATVRTVGKLEEELVFVRLPQSITYITDIAPSPDNIEKAIKLADRSTLLIIEAVFLDEDEEHAISKNHLTVNKAKKIFLQSNSEFVRFAHFAARYEKDKSRFMSSLYDGLSGKIYKPE